MSPSFAQQDQRKPTSQSPLGWPSICAFRRGWVAPPAKQHQRTTNVATFGCAACAPASEFARSTLLHYSSSIFPRSFPINSSKINTFRTLWTNYRGGVALSVPTSLFCSLAFTNCHDFNNLTDLYEKQPGWWVPALSRQHPSRRRHPAFDSGHRGACPSRRSLQAPTRRWTTSLRSELLGNVSSVAAFYSKAPVIACPKPIAAYRKELP